MCSSATKDAPAAADDSVRLLPRPRLPEPDSADSSLKGRLHTGNQKSTCCKQVAVCVLLAAAVPCRPPNVEAAPRHTGLAGNTTHNSKTAQWQQLGKGEKFAAETITETSGGASSIRFHDPAGPAPPSGNVPTGKDAGRIGSPSAAATHQAAPSGAPQHVPASTPSACAFVQSPDAPVSATAAPLGSRHDPAASPQPPPTHEPNTPLSPAPAASPCDTPAPNAQPLALLPTPLPVTAVQSTTTRDGDKAHTGQQHQRELKQQQAAPPPSACSPSPLVAAAQAALQAHLREQRLRRQHTAQRHYYHFTSAAVAHRAGEEADGQGAQAEGVLHAGDGSSEPGSYVQLRRPFPLHEQAATPGPSVGPIPPLVLPPGAATASAATPGFTPRQQAGLNGSVSMKVGVSVQGRAEDDLLWGTAPRLSDGGGLDLELEPRTHSTRSSNGASGPSDSSGAASPSFLRLAEMRAASATATQGIPATMPLPGTNSYNVDARAAGVMQPPALARPSTADVLQLPTPPSQQQLRRVKPPPHLVPPSSARLRLPDPPATIKPPTHAGQATSSYVPANTPGVTDWSAPASGSVLDASASKAASGGGGVAGAWRKGRRLLQRIGWVMGWKRQGQKQQQQQPDGATGSSMGENRTASRFDPRLLYDSDEQAKAVARAIINTYLNTPPAGSAPSAGQARQGSSRGAGSQQGVWPQVQQESGDVGHGEGGSSIHSVEQAYAALAAMAAAAAEQERLAAELAAWLPDHPVSHVAVQGEVMRLQRDLLRAQVGGHARKSLRVIRLHGATNLCSALTCLTDVVAPDSCAACGLASGGSGAIRSATSYLCCHELRMTQLRPYS